MVALCEARRLPLDGARGGSTCKRSLTTLATSPLPRLRHTIAFGGYIWLGFDRLRRLETAPSAPRHETLSFERPHYVAKVERLVIDALRLQLANPDLIKEYVKTYREERNRVERAARKQRGNLEREHSKAKSEIQRIVGAIARGTIDDDEAVALLNPLRAECRRIEAELAAAESHTNVIELHPQAVQRFKENLEDLAAILTDRDATPELALIGSFRSLVEAVIVRPRKAGEEYEVRIRGHLAALMGLEVSALPMVAGERLEPPMPFLLFSVRLATTPVRREQRLRLVTSMTRIKSHASTLPHTEASSQRAAAHLC